MKKIYFLACLSLLSVGILKAQIAAWEFNGNAGSEVTVSATTLNANLSPTSITRGAGLTASALGNAYSSTNFTASGTFADAVTNNKYLQFTIAATSTYKVSLSTLDATFRRSGTGPNAFQWQYSLNGFSTAGVNMGLAISYTLTSTNGDAQTQIDLSGIAALQNVTNPAVITIRLYGWGASATSGTFALGRLTGNDLAIGGTVVPASGATPDIVLSSPTPAVPVANILQGSTNNPVYRFDLAVTTADAVLTGVTVNTAGTYLASDVTNFKCWYSADAIFSSGSDVLLSTKTAALGAGSQVFPLFNSQSIGNGSTGYIFITADLPCNATVSNTLSVNAITTADISFASGNKTGTAFAGGTQTITAATPIDVTTPAASVGNTTSDLTWVNPTGCYDEVMIVGASGAPNSGTPSGDGTAYTASTVFASGTGLGNGFVLYKGSTSPQTITSLTNGTTYYFKFFTRLGTTWSVGVEVNATPANVTSPTDYFRSAVSGSWGTLATWQSSSDSATWIAATLIPGATAAHVVVQSPDSVWLTADRTTLNLTILSGARFNALTNTVTVTAQFNMLGTSAFYQGGTVQSVPGAIYKQALSVTSNFHYNGAQNGLSSSLPEFGNLFFEPTPTGSNTFQNSNGSAPFNNGLVVRGNMTINLQGATVREIRFGTGGSVFRTHTIDGNLNIIGTNSLAVVQNGTIGSVINVGGNINLLSGATLHGLNSTGQAIVNLKGNLNNGGIVETGAGGAGSFSINYTGTSLQTINSTGGTFTFAANQVDTVNNAAGVTFNTPITHAGTIRFVNGKVNTTATNLLTFAAGAFALNASNSSFVNGPVKKIGNTTFTFPVGRASAGYVPIGLSNFTGASAATDALTAEYIRGSAMALGTISAPNIDHVSYCDYWKLDLNNGTPTVDVTGYWNTNNPCGPSPYIDDFTKIELVHFNGTNWDLSSWGFSGRSGNNTAGDVTWPGVTSFSPFSLGSTTNANPLPITINYFTGVKQSDKHLLNWKVTCNSTPFATLVMERSVDGQNFKDINSIYATSLRCEQPFNYTDESPFKGLNYYRLKMIDADGKITYSSIVTLVNNTKGIDVQNIAPNPVTSGMFNLKLSTATAAGMQLIISDLQGRNLQMQKVNLAAGYNMIPLKVFNLAAGTYQLSLQTTDGDRKTMRFVIQ